MGALDRRQSLALLDAAYDAGVRHFDVAPMYGFGEAETCLGEFLARRRADVTVTTKYGIPPGQKKGWLGVARSVAKPVVKLLPGVQSGLSLAASRITATKEKSSFTAAHAGQSLDRSLAALRTDHIDLWLLHEVTSDHLRDDAQGLLRLMEDAVAAGKIGSFGVASERAKVETMVIKRPAFCGTVQFEWSVMDRRVQAVPGFRIHHRALTDNFKALHDSAAKDPVRCRQWSDAVGANLADDAVLAALMLKAALVENPGTVVLFSSKDPAHMQRNARVAEDAALEAPAKQLYALVQAAAKDGRAVEAGG